MPAKDLRQSFTTFVQQLKTKVQRLTGDVTSVEVSTYSVDAPQIESVVASADVAALAVDGASSVKRQGYTQVTFHCDVNACTETGRQDEVDAAVHAMHHSTVDQALAGRETLLDVGREVLKRVRS